MSAAGPTSSMISVAPGIRTQDMRSFSDQSQGILRVRLPYVPRAPFIPYHRRSQRFCATVAHRRCGKTVAEVNEGIRRILSIKDWQATRPQAPPQAAFISPTRDMGKRNAWKYAKYYTQGIPGMKIMESELTLTFPNGGSYMFLGADNIDSLRGLYLDHATLDEFGQQHQDVWFDVVRHTLSDFMGTATFIGSAKGRNHFYAMIQKHKHTPDWLVMNLKASETKIIPQDELDKALRDSGYDKYQQEYENNFDAAVSGTYYGSDIYLAEQEKRITAVPYDRYADVFAGFDLGIGDAMAVWLFQIVGKEWHFIDYYENDDEDLPHYVDWLNSKPYKIKEIYLPHDGAARELQTGKSRQKFLEDRGFRTSVVPRGAVDDGINQCRLIFNRSWFDAAKCERGIDCLRMYRKAYNEKLKVFLDKPLHDWASNGADAFRTGVMGVYEERPNMTKRYTQPTERSIFDGSGPIHTETSWMV